MELIFRIRYAISNFYHDYLSISAREHHSDRLKHGLGYRDLWNFDAHMARLFVRALPRFKNSHPDSYTQTILRSATEYTQENLDAWDAAVDRTIRAFEKYLEFYCELNTDYEDIDRELTFAFDFIRDNFGQFWY